MFISHLEPDNNPDDYCQITIDNKTFYYKKPVMVQKPIKKRYSDQFKDDLYIAKDKYRKLKMMKNFNSKYKNITEQTEKYTSCVEELIDIFKKEFLIEPKLIFKSFNLINLGIKPEDYGLEEEHVEY